MDDDVKFLKKNIRVTGLEVHPTERALVVQYELEAAILGTLGDRMTGERRQCQKIIRLKDLTPRTDIGALAREVVSKCRLIPNHRVAEVEQLIYYLQNRRNESPGSSKFAQRSADSSLRDDFGTPVGQREYIESLYEDIPEKVKGTNLILQLARNSDNLEELLSNETLLGALARVLREDWKKSYDLAINIAYSFFCFSTFRQFHSMISHFKIGALCVQILEFELKRYDTWQEELVSQTDSVERSKIDGCFAKQETLMRVCIYLLMHLSEDVKVEVKMVNRGIVEILCKTLERKRNIDLLVIAMAFLKKLSVYRENKDRMAASLIVERVCALLPTKDQNVGLSISSLLYNLSFDTELRRKMVKFGAPGHVSKFVSSDVSVLQECALKVLYHLSMEDDCKILLTYTDVIPVCMRIALSAPSDPVVKNVTEASERVCLALLINLALCQRNAQLIAGTRGEAIGLLIEAAYERKNAMLMKLIRNLAWADEDGPTRNVLGTFCPRLCVTLVNSVPLLRQSRQSVALAPAQNSDFLFAVEILGLLGELRGGGKNESAVKWEDFVEEYGLGEMIESSLQPDHFPDDILLQIVILVGTISQQEGGARALVQRSTVNLLIDLLSAKQEDDDIVLQIVYVFYQLMFHEGPRETLLNDTQVPAYLIDLMNDKNAQIRKMCDGTLEVIAEAGAHWSQRIGVERFRWHNAQWLEMVGCDSGLGAELGEGQHDGQEETRYALDEQDEPELFGAFHDAEDVLDDVDSSGSDGRPQARIDYR